jgi:hypothetical protein
VRQLIDRSVVFVARLVAVIVAAGASDGLKW